MERVASDGSRLSRKIDVSNARCPLASCRNIGAVANYTRIFEIGVLHARVIRALSKPREPGFVIAGDATA